MKSNFKKMKYKLIETHQEHIVVCDNPNCDFKEENIEDEEIPKELNKDRVKEIYLYGFVDEPCPKCGENLLTYEDFKQAIKITRYVGFVNRWFGWLGFFFRNKKKIVTEVKVHNGIHIKEKPSQE